MSNALLFLIVLVCPITMGTMMFFMMRDNKKKDESNTDSSDKTK